MIRVLIADDQPLVRAGLRVLFEDEADIATVARRPTARRPCSLARHTRPDVVLMDIRMPVLDGSRPRARSRTSRRWRRSGC